MKLQISLLDGVNVACDRLHLDYAIMDLRLKVQTTAWKCVRPGLWHLQVRNKTESMPARA